jgi:hypothetical protein
MPPSPKHETVTELPRRRFRDAVAVLSLFLAALFLLPARLVVPALGGIGTPARLLALGLAAWWVSGRLVPTFGLARGPQPVRTGIFVYGWWTLLTYALAYRRPLSDLEASGSDRAVITLIAMCGLALFVADGIGSRARLDVLVRRVVLFTTVMAAIGVVQFLTPIDPVQYIRLPGLVENREIVSVGARSIFDRPYSTALHPIEFGVVLAMVFPLALHRAMSAVRGRGWARQWLSVLLIAAAIPMTLSRSAILGVAAGLVVLALSWSWPRRANVAVAILVFTGLMRVAVPGLVGTLRNLFLKAENDPSIQGRLSDIGLVKKLLSEFPWFGMGHGTYDLGVYGVLDNQYFSTAVQSGVIGVVTLLFLLAVAGVAARRAVRRPRAPDGPQLGQALLASIVVAAVAMATFDGFAFRIFTGLLFLLLGCCGALWRLERERDQEAPADEAVRAEPGVTD